MDRATKNLSKLPPRAFIDNRPDAKGTRRVIACDAPVIAITRGETGYHEVYTFLTADELNATENVTPAQREAMFVGSLLGFHVPAADADHYDATGQLLRTAASAAMA